jgi:hypothetical protein
VIEVIGLNKDEIMDILINSYEFDVLTYSVDGTTKQNIADLIETIVTKNNIKLEEDIKQIINQVKNY